MAFRKAVPASVQLTRQTLTERVGRRGSTQTQRKPRPPPALPARTGRLRVRSSSADVFPVPLRPAQKTGGDARSVQAGPAPRDAPARCSPCGIETITRAILRELAHQAVARHLGDDRGGRDREHQPVAADHGIAVARRIEPVAAIDEHVFRHFRQRMHRPRQRPQRRAQDIVAIDPRRRGKGDRERCGRADLLEQFLAAFRRQPLGIVDPLGIRFGSSTTAAATTGPASGPRPASSQPATGQTPRLISARSRRKLGGATAITPLGSLA